jgi:PhnB protein
MQVQPYLDFNGRCDEAIEFYKSALGAKVNMMMRFKEMPGGCAPGTSPDVGEKVMHSSLSIGDSIVLMSDGRCQGKTTFHGIALSLLLKDDARAEQCFTALAEGGNVTMPLTKTFFSSSFGMVNDRFGVGWMVLVQA